MGVIYSYFFGRKCIECNETIKYASYSDICLACLFKVSPSAVLVDDDIVMVNKTNYTIGEVR